MADAMMEDEVNATESRSLFYNVTFTLIPTGLDPVHADTLIEDMKAQGGDFIPLDPKTGRIKKGDLVHLTHIIATTSDFPDYEEAFEQMRHVVKPKWVDVSITKGKLSNPRQFSPDPALFMSDVVVTFAKDIPEGDKEAIVGAVHAMGGQYSGSLSKMCTHLVALGMGNERCELVLKKRLSTHIILPHWFDDCLKLGKRIKETPYLLPDPDILRLDHGPLSFRERDAHKEIKGASSPTPKQFPLSPRSPGSSEKPRSLTVFEDRCIFLSSDLRIGSHLLYTLEELIQAGGGKIVKKVTDCDTYIGHYRDGTDYILAAQSNKEVGNLCWLYHLIQHNAWTSPLRRLLHYPIPRNGIPGFEKFRISISNYTGEARTYLESLVKAAGGDFTKTMRQDNTHLITAHLISEKCDAAKEWNINLVNHLWLEESYAKCELQTLTHTRYTHFPSRTNLGEVIGQTRIDKMAVQRFYFPDSATLLEVATLTPSVNNPKSSASAAPPKNNVKPASVLQTSSGLVEVEEGDTSLTVGGANADRVDDTTAIEGPSELINPPTYQTESYRPTPQAKRTVRDAKTPATSKLPAGKENETPSTTGSRGAKARALNKLHDSAADIALYEQERKRKGGVVYGGRKVSDPDRVGSTKDKRKREPQEEIDTEEVEAPRRGKKAKSDGTHRVLLTAYKGFEGLNAKQEADAKNKLRNIGIHLTEAPDKATILCAPKIVRTRKFVAAIARAPYVLNTGFIDHCLKHDEMPASLDEYSLADRDAEKRFGFNLETALERAKANKGKLLSDFQIFVTETVPGGYETYKDIIHANGGETYLYKGTARVNMTSREEPTDEAIQQNRESDELDVVYLISGCSNEEMGLWKKFREMVRKQGLRARVVTSEWLLQCAMSQEFSWDAGWELKEGKVPT